MNCPDPFSQWVTISQHLAIPLQGYHPRLSASHHNHGIGGRKAFPKCFKDLLVKRFGSRDAITGEHYQPRYLQIDHRVPYEVSGDSSCDEERLEVYMLLTASSQRAKSWSCEQCSNWQQDKDTATCSSCFWASPEAYSHMAGEQVRRVDVEWRGAEVKTFESIRDKAEVTDTTIAAVIKTLLAQALS